ncbi:MAG: hypothetical protein WAV76_15085 [Bacteroidota bacterium]
MNICRKNFLFLFAYLGMLMLPGLISAQSLIKSVDVNLQFTEYDVLYLTDFINVRTQTLSPNISGISMDLMVTNPAGGTGNVYVAIKVMIKLQGDISPSELVEGKTNLFSIKGGTRTLAARDFANGNSDVYIVNNGYILNDAVKTRLENLATTITTAPPGVYQVFMTVYNESGQQVGGASKTITVSISTPDQVLVEINSPTNGSFSTNLAPTFNWTTQASGVYVKVFEVGPTQHSPQDALTGSNPSLVRQLNGVSSLTYPSDAQRQLQQEKAYVLQVSAIVTTNRGEVDQASLPVVFRITDDKVGQILDNFFNVLGGQPGTTYSTLRADPNDWVVWQTYGGITLDGATIMGSDLQAVLNTLSMQTDTKIRLSVENQ